MVKLFVAGISLMTSEIELLELFSAQAIVRDINLIKDRDKNFAYCFVTLPDQQAAERAIKALDGKWLGNRRISVKVARDRNLRLSPL